MRFQDHVMEVIIISSCLEGIENSNGYECGDAIGRNPHLSNI